jgi:enamine deaminase RidA (YjgF/YER057c/UK114 family)
MPALIHAVEGRSRPRGYSEATSGGGLLCISGQLPAEAILEQGASFAEQFTSSIQRFAEVMSAVGARADDLLLIRIYVTDMEAFHAGGQDSRAAYKEVLGGHYPATTLVEVAGLVDPRAMVEIEGLAHLSESG